MLKFTRIALAVASLVIMLALFFVPCSAVYWFLGWLPKMQLVPAVLSASGIALGIIVVMTLLFGRLYCSVICPLGIAQDLAFVHLGKGKWLPKFPLWVRVIILVVAIGLMGLGAAWMVDPYAIFGRALALGTVWAVVWLALILFAAFFHARWWCNNICPVGTLLGLFARWAVFRVRIDTTKCVACEQCVKKCDKGAIPSGKDKRLDYTRCVACYNCMGSCKKGALKVWFR